MTGAELVVAHARSMIGVPWRHQGRKPWAVDCAGLVVLSFESAGWPGATNSPARYGRDPWDDMLRRTLVGHFGAPVADSTMQQGDVALIRWGRGEPSHVGIIAGHPVSGLSIIHSSNHPGVVEVSLTSSLLECIVEVYRPQWGDDDGR